MRVMRRRATSPLGGRGQVGGEGDALLQFRTFRYSATAIMQSALKRAFTTTLSRGTTRPATRSFSATACSCSTPPSDNNVPVTATPKAARRPDLAARDLRYLANLSPSDLAAFDPTLDLHPSNKFSPSLSPSQQHPVHVTHSRQDQQQLYQQPRPSPDLIDSLPGEDDSTSHLAQLTDLSTNEIRNLYRFPLIVKRVVSMKSKGKMPSMYSLVVVGNGRGLVGVGEGNDETANKAVSKAFNQAVRSMDYVERYEDRTVWGTMESNFGSCKIQMRSRPPGEPPSRRRT